VWANVKKPASAARGATGDFSASLSAADAEGSAPTKITRVTALNSHTIERALELKPASSRNLDMRSQQAVAACMHLAKGTCLAMIVLIKIATGTVVHSQTSENVTPKLQDVCSPAIVSKAAFGAWARNLLVVRTARR
jgi:hypothetical protein